MESSAKHGAQSTAATDSDRNRRPDALYLALILAKEQLVLGLFRLEPQAFRHKE